MKEDLQLNLDAFLPLRDVVFNTLRDAILRGELKPISWESAERRSARQSVCWNRRAWL